MNRCHSPHSDGRVHCTGLQVRATDHCNKKCMACSSLSPLCSKHDYTAQSLAHDLGCLAKVLHVSEVCLSGGEPMLNPDRGEMLDAIHNCGVAGEVLLITNGYRVAEELDPKFWSSLHRLLHSVYPDQSQEFQTNVMTACQRHGVGYYAHGPSFSYALSGGRRTVAERWKHCSTGGSCMCLREGRLFWCWMTASLEVAFEEHYAEDSIAVEGITTAALFRYLDACCERPLESCRECTGFIDRGEVGWKQAASRGEWLRGSTETK